MVPSLTRRTFMAAYGGLWRAVRPILRRNARLAQRYDERLVPQGWAAPADIWMQAASGGESYLAWEVLKALPADATFGLLLTSCTTQGIAVLEQAAAWAAEHRPGVAMQVRIFPFDEPVLMQRALGQVAPRGVVLLETELWPGLLTACRKADVPVAVLNGRMTPASFVAYLAMERFWRGIAPEYVAAISPDDAMRFSMLFGTPHVDVMPNIKFDRVVPQAMPGSDAHRVAALLPAGSQVVVLGSVREEEEAMLSGVARALCAAHPEAVVVVAPRHMHRVAAWQDMLLRDGVDAVLRSGLEGPAPVGSVVLWDAFGELGALYGAAQVVFVGGSLAPLGGQNYLEPLAQGVVPCVGPYLDNFAWVGDGLEEAGLLEVVPDAPALTAALLRRLDAHATASRADVLARFTAWAAPRRGGARRAAERVLALLQRG